MSRIAAFSIAIGAYGLVTHMAFAGCFNSTIRLYVTVMMTTARSSRACTEHERCGACAWLASPLLRTLASMCACTLSLLCIMSSLDVQTSRGAFLH